MENIIEKYLEKMNQEMNKEHSEAIDSIHNWLCEQTNDIELVNGVLTEGKSIESSLSYVAKKVSERVKSRHGAAVLTDNQIMELVRDYFIGNEGKIEKDPFVTITSSGEKIREVVKEVVKEVTVSLDKKSQNSIKTIFDLDVSDEEKMKLLRSLISDDKDKSKKDDELMSIFDFGIEDIEHIADVEEINEHE